MNNLLKRTVSGVVFAAIMLFAFLSDKILIRWLDPQTTQLCSKLIFGATFLFALVVMMKEFLRMTCGKEYRYSQILSIVAGATLFTLVFLYKAFDIPGRMVILAFIPVFVLMINSLYVKDKTRFDKFANLYTAILYIAVPLCNVPHVHPCSQREVRAFAMLQCNRYPFGQQPRLWQERRSRQRGCRQRQNGAAPTQCGCCRRCKRRGWEQKA